MLVRWAGTAWWPQTACWHRHWRVGAWNTNPEEHQMARDNNPMSLHSPTRTGYVQIDKMRTMREQRPWCQMRSRVGVTVWHGRQCRTPHSDRATQELTRVAYSCWTKYHLQLSVVLFPCCALSYRQTEAQETVRCQSCDYTGHPIMYRRPNSTRTSHATTLYLKNSLLKTLFLKRWVLILGSWLLGNRRRAEFSFVGRGWWRESPPFFSSEGSYAHKLANVVL